MPVIDRWEYKRDGPGAPSQRIIGLGDRLQLRAVRTPGAAWQWSLVRVSARGSTRSWPLPDLGEPSQVETAARAAVKTAPELATALLLLPSLGNRPSDYSATRERLEELRAAGDVAGIIGLIPVGVKVGLVKAGFDSADERAAAAAALEAWPTGRSIALAICTPPADTRTVTCRIPSEVYEALAREGLGHLMNPGQFVAQLLRERYSSG